MKTNLLLLLYLMSPGSGSEIGARGQNVANQSAEDSPVRILQRGHSIAVMEMGAERSPQEQGLFGRRSNPASPTRSKRFDDDQSFRDHYQRELGLVKTCLSTPPPETQGHPPAAVETYGQRSPKPKGLFKNRRNPPNR